MEVLGNDMDLAVGKVNDARLAPEPEQPRMDALRARSQLDLPASLTPTDLPTPQATSASQTAPVQNFHEGQAIAGVSAGGSALVSAGGQVSPSETKKRYKVQLAALKNREDAEKMWKRLKAKAPDLLAERRPAIEAKRWDHRVVYRLRLGNFDSLKAARLFCMRLRAYAIACTPDLL